MTPSPAWQATTASHSATSKKLITTRSTTTTNTNPKLMKWNYNSLPDTARDVLACYADKTGGPVFYERVRLNLKGDALLAPDRWTLIAWADFPRCFEDDKGRRIAHHPLTIEGLKQ